MMSLRKFHRTVDGHKEKRCGKCKRWLLIKEFSRDKTVMNYLEIPIVNTCKVENL